MLMSAVEKTSETTAVIGSPAVPIGGWLRLIAVLSLLLGAAYAITWLPVVISRSYGVQSIFELLLQPVATYYFLVGGHDLLNHQVRGQRFVIYAAYLMLAEAVFMNLTSYYISRRSGAIDGIFDNSAPYPFWHVVGLIGLTLFLALAVTLYFRQSDRAKQSLN
jgi:hypothetical protein